MNDDELVQAVKARLESALPAVLAAAGLPPVTEFLDYDPGLPVATKAPQVWVDLPEDNRSADSSRGATLQKYSHKPSVMVGVSGAGNNPSLASRQLRQLVGHIRQVLEAEPTLGGTVLWVRWIGTSYTPNVSKNPTGLFKLAGLFFDINYRTRYGQE